MLAGLAWPAASSGNQGVAKVYLLLYLLYRRPSVEPDQLSLLLFLLLFLVQEAVG